MTFEAVEQVFAEAASANEREENHVRSGHDTDVHFDLVGTAETHEFAFLNDAQELGLRFRADGAISSKKMVPLVGNFKETFLEATARW